MHDDITTKPKVSQPWDRFQIDFNYNLLTYVEQTSIAI